MVYIGNRGLGEEGRFGKKNIFRKKNPGKLVPPGWGHKKWEKKRTGMVDVPLQKFGPQCVNRKGKEGDFLLNRGGYQEQKKKREAPLMG